MNFLQPCDKIGGLNRILLQDLDLFRFFVLSIAILFASAIIPAFANSSSCDSRFNDAMEARATMVAQREIEMAETFLKKPDSVLAYSCFLDDMRTLNVAAQGMLSANVGPRLFHIPPIYFSPRDMFQPGNYLYQYTPEAVHSMTPFQQGNPSHPLTSAEGPVPNIDYDEGIWYYSYPPDPSDNPYPIPGPDHFANTLTIMIVDALFTHLGSNFNHGYLGNGSSPARDCYMMQMVWDAARCTNFEKSDFHTFSEMRGSDPRQDPRACSGSRPWAGLMSAARMAPPTAVKTYRRRMTYEYRPRPKCETDSLIVETGVTVFTGMSGQEREQEKVCSLPSCYYDPNQNKCLP